MTEGSAKRLRRNWSFQEIAPVIPGHRAPASSLGLGVSVHFADIVYVTHWPLSTFSFFPSLRRQWSEPLTVYVSHYRWSR